MHIPNLMNPAVWLLALVLSLGMTSAAEAAEEIVALTEPSSDIVMSFTVAGRVKNVPVREGQAVKAGDLLIELNVEALEARLKQLTLEAENQAEVLASEAELKQKRQDLIKLERAFRKGAATRIELEHARLDVEISEFRLQAARHTQEVAVFKKEEAEAEIKEYRMLSPVDGLVEKIEVEVGESAKTSEDAVRVVALNPLWVETDAPLERFGDLSPGRELKVTFPDGLETAGRLVFRGAVADSASETVRVRLEVANPQGRHAGERVVLSIPENKKGR